MHVSRYGNSQQGGEMHWKVAPQRKCARARVVLVVDDILDEGETLHAIKQRVMELGARQVLQRGVCRQSAMARTKPIQADFVGLEVPDRFVFGYGMDIHGAWRNLPAIYATKGK